MNVGLIKLSTAFFICISLVGCTTYRYSATSNPSGAMIYRGTTPDNLNYYLTTPYFEDTPNPKGWTGNYFQARMSGYKDSPITVATTTQDTGIVHFDLTPGKTDQPVITSPTNKVSPAVNITAPTPIQGNSGNYMSPFTAAGAVAPWAQKREAVTDNGSDVAGAVGGAVGQHVANKALDFVPFGLGGMFGNNAGNTAARAVTKTTIEPALPTQYEAKLSTDISFETIEQLAVYMHVKNSAHSEYSRILAMTKQVYPELQNSYQSAIEIAAQAASTQAEKKVLQKKTAQTAVAKESQTSADQSKQSNTKDRLDELKQLKDKGYITEAEYKTKRSDILKSL